MSNTKAYSCELNQLFKQWDAGSEYNAGDAALLQIAFEQYLTDTDLLNQQSLHAHKVAEALFDRQKTYAALAAFILIGDVPAATAILDRFLHHANLIKIKGKSCRMKEAAATSIG